MHNADFQLQQYIEYNMFWGTQSAETLYPTGSTSIKFGY